MFQEMKVEEALKEYIKGRKVVLMDTIQMPDETTQYQCKDLRDMFLYAVLLVDMPDEPRKEQKETSEKESPPLSRAGRNGS